MAAIQRVLGRVAAALTGVCVFSWVLAEPAPASRQPTNEAGQPVLRADGSRIVYPRAELERAASARTALPRAAVAPRGAASSAGLGALASWGYGSYGRSIATAGMVSLRVSGETELYTGGSDGYWYALRWDRARARFDQVYISDHVGSGIKRVLLQRMGKALAPQLVVALPDGRLRRYDPATKKLLGVDAGSCETRGGLVALAVADLDANGSDELLSLCGNEALVVEGNGYAGWSLAGVGGRGLAVGQMDDDPALEIASTTGRVVDTATRSVQWTWAQGFAAHVMAGDIDGDGRDELIAADGQRWVWAYDVERQRPKWALPVDRDITAVLYADIDGDGVKEILLGDGQWGAIRAYNATTLQELGSMPNAEHGVTQIAVVDLDGDGRPELLWGAGATSTGSDHLFVADWPTRTVRWQNADLVGPFLGPLVGDLDGDGVKEVVIVTTAADANHESGRIIVFDSRTMAVRAMSAPIGDNLSHAGVRDIKLRDIDGDGRLEIVVAADRQEAGLIEAYSLSAANVFTRVWRNASLPAGSPFTSVEVADVDGDGRPDVLAGVTRTTTQSEGIYLYAYDGQTGALKWRTVELTGEVGWVLPGDYDGDGVLEIAVGIAGRGVWIFNAATHQLEATIPLPSLSSLTRMDAFATPRLLVGHADGRATVHAFDGGVGYYEVSSVQLSVGRIDAINVGANRTWWVASGGRLSCHAGALQTLQSANYGPGFGRWVDSIGMRASVFSTGFFGLHRLEVNC